MVYRLSTVNKKSTVEFEVFKKGDLKFKREIGYRYGVVLIETTDGELPNLDINDVEGSGIDVFDLSGENIESVELESLDDPCWEELHFGDDFPEDIQELIETGLEEDGPIWLEENGWSSLYSELYFIGPLRISDEEDVSLAEGSDS